MVVIKRIRIPLFRNDEMGFTKIFKCPEKVSRLMG
jgi:hypothetical protein